MEAITNRILLTELVRGFPLAFRFSASVNAANQIGGLAFVGGLTGHSAFSAA
jgi:hypothetical protein